VNREVVLSNFALCACECEFQITYIKSFAVDKLLADNTLATPVDNLVTGFNLEAYWWRQQWMVVVPGAMLTDVE